MGSALDELRRAERCYLSTPEHGRSFYGRVIYLYLDRGTLEADARSLRFAGSRGVVDIPRGSVVELGMGAFWGGAKPPRLERLEVTYLDGGNAGPSRTVLLVPTRSALTPTWVTNGIVRDWLGWLRRRTAGVAPC